MKKQPKTKRTTSNPVSGFDENGNDLNPWPPPDIDPSDTKALSAALPWNQPSGMVQVPFNIPEPVDEDDHLTPEERRRKYFRTATPENVEWFSRRDMEKKCGSYSWDKNLTSYQHALSRLHPRDTSTGTYVGAGEAFHVSVAKACEKGQTPDDNAMDMLLKGQPWRKAIAVAPNREQPVPTYGPMQLPESYDPVASLDADPAVETRPTHWTPDTPAAHIISGAVHDFGNYLSALIARQVVALGFAPK